MDVAGDGHQVLIPTSRGGRQGGSGGMEMLLMHLIVSAGPHQALHPTTQHRLMVSMVVDINGSSTQERSSKYFQVAHLVPWHCLRFQKSQHLHEILETSHCSDLKDPAL